MRRRRAKIPVESAANRQTKELTAIGEKVWSAISITPAAARALGHRLKWEGTSLFPIRQLVD